MATAAERLAEFATSLSYEQTPDEVLDAAKLHLLDTVGCGLAARGLGIAGSFAGGLFAYLDDATATKPLHPAWAAHGGVLAARLAGLGAEGPPGVIEGRFGLYHAFVGAGKGELPIDEEIESLGEHWETP